MDISSASALALYSYQTALRSLGQTSASSTESAPDATVLQALASAYGNTDASAGGLLPASDALSALAGSSALPSLVSGLYDASVDGFSAISPDAALALTEYANQQNGVAGNLAQAAEARAASIDTSRQASVLAAIQSAQAASFTGTMNLLA